MTLMITLPCPHCAAVVDMQTRNQGVCTRCRANLTVTVSETWSRTQINREAPFFPLVEMIDGLNHSDPRRGDRERRGRTAWRS